MKYSLLTCLFLDLIHLTASAALIYEPYTFVTISQPLYSPTGLRITASGSLFFTEQAANVVRRLDPDGSLHPVAGMPQTSGHGDGMGSAATFFLPAGLAVDVNDNLYVADTWNHLIRKITPAGVVTTVAGKWVDDGTGRGAGDFADGPAFMARFNHPTGVAVDASGTVYVMDSGNSLLRKIENGVVSTVAGKLRVAGSANGTGADAQFGRWVNPNGIALGPDGNIYVADAGNSTIRKVTPQGVVTTIAGRAGVEGHTDGRGTAARFNWPNDVALDSQGTIFVVDGALIRKIAPDGTVTTIAGSLSDISWKDGTGKDASFNGSRTIAVAGDGTVYVADGYGYIRKGIPAADAPVFLKQPAGGNTEETTRFGFEAVANGQQPMSYQWYQEAIDGDLRIILNANSTRYRIEPVLAANAGTYWVVASNALGQAASSRAVLTTYFRKPQIVTQPAPVTVATPTTRAFISRRQGPARWNFNG